MFGNRVFFSNGALGGIIDFIFRLNKCHIISIIYGCKWIRHLSFSKDLILNIQNVDSSALSKLSDKFKFLVTKFNVFWAYFKILKCVCVVRPDAGSKTISPLIFCPTPGLSNFSVTADQFFYCQYFAGHKKYNLKKKETKHNFYIYCFALLPKYNKL